MERKITIWAVINVHWQTELAADRQRAVDFVALAGLPEPAVAADLQLELVAVDSKSQIRK